MSAQNGRLLFSAASNAESSSELAVTAFLGVFGVVGIRRAESTPHKVDHGLLVFRRKRRYERVGLLELDYVLAIIRGHIVPRTQTHV
jgi:hypothetical protein